MQTIIGHIDLDCFFVSVERVKQPHLNGKLIIVGGTSGRGVVSACSYETRKYGVHSAMPMAQAMRLCPEAIIVNGSYADYSYYSNLVTEIIRDEVPLFEKASVDEFYIDLTGMERFFSCSELSKRLLKRITTETGLPVSYGMGTSKMISKIAANECKPNGYLEVPPGTEKEFLKNLSIDRMHMIGEKTAIVLRNMRIHTLGDLATAPVKVIEDRLGKSGRILWERANGIDNRSVEAARDQKSISKEETYFTDTNNTGFLEMRLVDLVSKVAHELREINRNATTLTLKIRYENFETFTKQITIEPTASDHLMVPHIKNLFHSLYHRNRAVRLIGVRLSNFVMSCVQGSLFEVSEQKPELYKTIDNLKNQFGNEVVRKAGGMTPKNPEQILKKK